jgi:hypothetical protein
MSLTSRFRLTLRSNLVVVSAAMMASACSPTFYMRITSDPRGKKVEFSKNGLFFKRYEPCLSSVEFYRESDSSPSWRLVSTTGCTKLKEIVIGVTPHGLQSVGDGRPLSWQKIKIIALSLQDGVSAVAIQSE